MLDSIRVGVVVARDEAACAVRVNYDDVDLVSAWLPVVQRGVGAFATYDLPNLGDQVVCVHPESGPEEGVCLGAIYSDAQSPAASGAGLKAIRFGAGSVEIESGAASITIVAGGGVEITGNVVVHGTVTAVEFLQGI